MLTSLLRLAVAGFGNVEKAANKVNQIVCEEDAFKKEASNPEEIN